MTIKTWTGSASTDWFTDGNWSPSGVPASGDDVVISTTSNGPLLNASTTVNSVAISNSASLTLSPSALTTLTAAGGVSLSSSGGIIGTGTVFAAVTVTGNSTIMASGGQLALSGPLHDNGNLLTLKINGNTDILTVSGGGGCTAHTVDFNNASGTLRIANSDLTVGTTVAMGKGKLDVEGGTLIDASGVTISTGTISGTGTVSAGITATGAARIATAQFGATLEIGGAIADSGNALTLMVTDSNGILQLDADSAAHTVNFNNASGLLQLIDSSLTVGTQMAIGSGQLFLGGTGDAVVTDASGVTVTTGTISGAGTLDAAVTATGAASIAGNGLTFEIVGPVTDSGNALTLSTTLGTLLLDSTSTAKAVTFASGGTLELAAGLTVGTAMAINSGHVQLQNANSSLTDAAGISLSGGSIIGLGTITGGLTGTGTVRAAGGLLELVTAIGNSTGTSFQIANAATNFLAASGTVGSGNTFTFLGADGGLLLGNDTGFDSTVSGLNVGAGGAETNFVDLEGHDGVTIDGVTGQGTTSGTITLSDGAVLILSNISSSNWNAHTASDGNGGTDVFLSDVACFCRGTRILTATGETPVEDLAIGDRVTTLSGGLRPVKWIGHRRYDPRFLDGNRSILPVCIPAAALSEGVPARDLWVSPDHALFLDGVLVMARLLLDGETIVQANRVASLEYFHVELDTHDVILAEGAPTETYVERRNRGMFHNAAEFGRLYPEVELQQTPFCVPRLEEGSAALREIRKVLAARRHAVVARGPIEVDRDCIVDNAA